MSHPRRRPVTPALLAELLLPLCALAWLGETYGDGLLLAFLIGAVAAVVLPVLVLQPVAPQALRQATGRTWAAGVALLGAMSSLGNAAGLAMIGYPVARVTGGSLSGMATLVMCVSLLAAGGVLTAAGVVLARGALAHGGVVDRDRSEPAADHKA